MLSKNKIKYIRSLELKKKRKEEQVFVAEGHKLVGNLYNSYLSAVSSLVKEEDISLEELKQLIQDCLLYTSRCV